MAVGSVPDRSSVEPSEYVFAVAREWAFTTATMESVEVLNSRSRLVASATMRVATTAGLIALKSVSLPRRADSNNPAKATSDTIDLLALIETESVEEVLAAISDAPPALRQWIASTTVHVGDHRVRSRRAMLRRSLVSPARPRSVLT